MRMRRRVMRRRRPISRGRRRSFPRRRGQAGRARPLRIGYRF